jgi:hypothetical protein
LSKFDSKSAFAFKNSQPYLDLESKNIEHPNEGDLILETIIPPDQTKEDHKEEPLDDLIIIPAVAASVVLSNPRRS